MPLHLIKLCVGTDSIEDLEDWIKLKFAEKKKRGVKKPERFHTTRMVPKRAEELIDGGSIFWVIRGEIMCRERILDIRPFIDKDGIGRCQLVLDPKCVPVGRGPSARSRAGAISMTRMRRPISIALAPRHGEHAGADAPRIARTRVCSRRRYCRSAASGRSWPPPAAAPGRP